MLWSCNTGQAHEHVYNIKQLFWIIPPFSLFLHRVNYSEAKSCIFGVITGDMYSENVLRCFPISWRTPFLYYRLIRTVGGTINEVLKLTGDTVSAKTFPALKSRKPEVHWLPPLSNSNIALMTSEHFLLIANKIPFCTGWFQVCSPGSQRYGLHAFFWDSLVIFL